MVSHISVTWSSSKPSRKSTDKSIHGVAERLAVALARLDAFIHIIFETDLI